MKGTIHAPFYNDADPTVILSVDGDGGKGKFLSVFFGPLGEGPMITLNRQSALALTAALLKALDEDTTPEASE